MLILPVIVSLLDSTTRLVTIVLEKLPPEIIIQEYKDHLARTKWLNDLAIKFSDQISALITKQNQ